VKIRLSPGGKRGPAKGEYASLMRQLFDKKMSALQTGRQSFDQETVKNNGLAIA
jgi:hypothetical protein